jgi:prefoldin alpha subunit
VSTPTHEQLEQQVQEDLMRLEAYRGQLNQMLQQHQLLAASRAEHLRARESLEGLERAAPESEVLLPLGGEAFVRGAPDRSGPVLLGIGSGYLAEIPRAAAIERLAQRTKQIEDAARELEGQMRALEERITLISRRVESLTERPGSAGDEAAGDVGRD